MTNQVRHINDSILSDEEIMKQARALAPVLLPLVSDEVFTREEAAEFVKYGRTAFDRFVKEGKFRSHHVGKGGPRFIKSELLEDLKKL